MTAVKRRCGGFTLIELIVTLLLVGLLFAMVPPLLSSGGLTTDMRGAARQVAAAMRVARNRAITEQQEAAVTLNLEQRRVSVGDRTIALPADEQVQLKLYTASAEQVDENIGRVRFFPDGSSTGGYVAVLDDRIEYRINVDWLTGRVSIEDRDPE